MRILLIDQFGELGGGQRCLLEAAQGFAARGWELHAAVPEGPLAKELAPLVRSVIAIPCGPFASGNKGIADAIRFAAQLPRQAAAIKRLVRAHSIDVLYVNGPRLLPATWHRLQPVIFHAHWSPPQRTASALARFALRATNATVLASSRFMARAYAHTPTRVIYNGVAAPNFEPRPRTSHTHVAMLGRISPEKGQLEFAQAAQRLPDLNFTICGSPMFSTPAYLESVRRAANRVIFRDWASDPYAFLNEIDLLVVPSQPIDNIPRVILEAFAAGVPVLAFASGGIPELIEDGETGLLVHEPTAAALAEAIREGVADSKRLNAIALRAHARWRSHYTLGRFQSEVCDAVESAARRSPTPLHNAGASAAA